MPSAILSPSVTELEGFDVRVTGPDCDVLSDADLRRLFAGGSLTERRLNRLREWPRVTITFDGRVVGVASCQKTDGEMLVPDLGIDVPAPTYGPRAVRCSDRDIMNALLDAIELASVAGGCRRVVISPPRISLAFLERRGYRGINERCAGGWIEKTLA